MVWTQIQAPSELRSTQLGLVEREPGHADTYSPGTKVVKLSPSRTALRALVELYVCRCLSSLNNMHPLRMRVLCTNSCNADDAYATVPSRHARAESTW